MAFVLWLLRLLPQLRALAPNDAAHMRVTLQHGGCCHVLEAPYWLHCILDFGLVWRADSV